MSLKRISLSKTNNNYRLEAEKRLYVQTFMNAYKNIPLIDLGIKALRPFLEASFEKEITDFKSSMPGIIFYRAIIFF